MMLSLNLSASKTVQNRKLLFTQGWWKRWGPGCLMCTWCGLLSSIVLREAEQLTGLALL